MATHHPQHTHPLPCAAQDLLKKFLTNLDDPSFASVWAEYSAEPRGGDGKKATRNTSTNQPHSAISFLRKFVKKRVMEPARTGAAVRDGATVACM